MFFFFFFNDTATTEIYTLSLHDALPISLPWAVKICALAASRSARSMPGPRDRKSTRLNSSHLVISYAVFCLKKKNTRTSALYAISDRRPPPIPVYIRRNMRHSCADGGCD